MKKKFFFAYLAFSFLLSSVVTTNAQSCPAPPPPKDPQSMIGSWEGHYTFSGKINHFKIDVRSEGQKLVASSNLPQMGIRGVELTTWLCKSNELHMRVDMPDGRVLKLIGSPDDNKMSGRLVYSSPAGTDREVFTVQKKDTKLF